MKQLELDVAVRHSAKEVWRLAIKNFQVTLPTVVPQHYSSVEYLDGPPLAPGGICQVKSNSDGNASLDLVTIRYIVSLMVPWSLFFP